MREITDKRLQFKLNTILMDSSDTLFSQTHKGINKDRWRGNGTGLDEAGVLQECLWGESAAEETSDKRDKD